MDILYLCDHHRCECCSYPECDHTTDISHARNFVPYKKDLLVEVECKEREECWKGQEEEIIAEKQPKKEGEPQKSSRRS